jgi:hypothetical protein
MSLLEDARYLVDLNNAELSGRALALKWHTSKSSVNAQRARLELERQIAGVEKADPAVGKLSGRLELGPDGGTFIDVQTVEPITDWADVFARFNLDPNAFVIVGDTVRMGTWQQSKALDDGSRDVVNLFSYRASFTRRHINEPTPAETEATRRRVQAWKLPQRIPGSGIGPEVAAVVNLADMQAGKHESGGIKGLLDRMLDGIENTQAYIDRQRKTGRNITELVLVNNGDPFEGIAGNYANQSHTVQGGLRAQMNHVLDIWEAYSRELFPQFDKGQFVTVHCNHTQFGRQGGAAKSITGDEDTGSAFLAESLQRILRGRPEFEHVKFTIPHDEMNVYADIAGVPVAFNHGHKIPGNDASGFEKWLNGQVRGDAQAHAARIWITAHRHHYAAWDMGSCSVFQAPSCEGNDSSKWLRDMNGKHSRSGILALLVGTHDQLGWSDQAFL